MLITQVKEKKVSKQIHVKVSAEDLQDLQKQADKFADGNLSEWLRYAGKNHTPPKEDLVQPPSKPKKKKVAR